MPKYTQSYHLSKFLSHEPNCRKLMGQIKGVMYSHWFAGVDTKDKKQLLDYMREIERHNLLLKWERVKEISRFTHNLNNKYNRR